MDELIYKLNNLNLDSEIPNDSIDSLCESMEKISLSPDSNIKQTQITQVINAISKLPLNIIQIKKLDKIGLLISNLIRKIKCSEFADAYTIPTYVY